MPTAALPATPRKVRPKIVWGTGTGIDTSAYDDVSGHYKNDPGLTVDGIGRDQDRAYAPGKSPALELTLSNHDGTYSPGGPLAGFLGRGPTTTLDVDFGVDVLVDATDVLVDDPNQFVDGYFTQRLFTGIANTMTHTLNQRAPSAVQVTALGASSSLLVKAKPTLPLSESIRTDQWFSAILDAVGWDPLKRVIGVGSTTLLYAWANGDRSARDHFELIRAAEGAGSCWYEDVDGVMHFEGQTFRSTNPSSTTVWIFSDGVISGNAIVDDPLYLVDAANVLVDGPLVHPLFHVGEPSYTANPDEIVKTVVGTVNVRTPTSIMKIWEYGSTIILTPNQVLDIKVSTSDPFKSAVTPAAATDYTVSAGSLAGVSLLATSGQTVTLRLTAGAGGATVLGVTSNGIQVRAVSLPVTTTIPVTSTVNTSTASARSQEIGPTDLGAWPEVDPARMLDVVNERALRYQRTRPQIQFQVQNIDASHIYAMLRMRISDRVRFIHTHAALNIVAWVEQLHYVIAPGGGLITLTVGCEQVFAPSGGKLDTDKYDICTFGI